MEKIKMKKNILFIYSLLTCSTVFAQSLAMPGDSAAMAAPQQQQTAPEPKQAEHYTPSASYKAERNAIRKGNKLFEQEKYHEALEAYDEALDVNGSSIRGKYNKAVTLLQLQSDDNKGTANDPRMMAARLFGELVNDARQYDVEIAEKALYNLGNIAFNDEKYDQSIEAYKASLRVNPENMKTRENLRLAQLKKQEQEENKQDQNQDKQQDKQEQQEQQQQQQQPQEQQQPMTQSAQQILQSMQNKENSTRRKVNEQEQTAAGRPQTDKPW